MSGVTKTVAPLSFCTKKCQTIWQNERNFVLLHFEYLINPITQLMKQKLSYFLLLLCMLMQVGAGRSWAGTFVPVNLPTASNIAAFKALDKNTEAILTLTNAKVTYVNANAEVFCVEDASGAILFEYDPDGDFTPQVNTVLNGTVTGKLYVPKYRNVEFRTTDDTDYSTLQVTPATGDMLPTLTTMANTRLDSWQMRYVKLEDVTVSEAPSIKMSRSAEKAAKKFVRKSFQVNNNGLSLMIEADDESINLGAILDGENKQYKLASIAGIVTKDRFNGEIIYTLKIIKISDITPYEDQTKNKLTAVTSIADFKKLANGEDAILTLTNARVTYARNNYYIIEDASGGFFFQTYSDFTAQVNQVLNGTITGKLIVDEEEGCSFIPTDKTDFSKLQVTNATDDLQPKLIMMADTRLESMENCYVKLEDITVSEAFTEALRLKSRSAENAPKKEISLFGDYQVNSDGLSLYLNAPRNVDLDELLDGENKQYKLASVAGILMKYTYSYSEKYKVSFYILNITKASDITPYQDQTKNKLNTVTSIADFKKLAIGEDAELKLRNAYVTMAGLESIAESRSAEKARKVSLREIEVDEEELYNMFLQDATGAIVFESRKVLFEEGTKLNGSIFAKKAIEGSDLLPVMTDMELTSPENITATDGEFTPKKVNDVGTLQNLDALYTKVRVGRSTVTPIVYSVRGGVKRESLDDDDDDDSNFMLLHAGGSSIYLINYNYKTGESFHFPKDLKYMEGVVMAFPAAFLEMDSRAAEKAIALDEEDMEPLYILVPTDFEEYVEVTEYKVDSEEEGEEIESGEQRQVAGVIMTAIDDMPVTDDPLTIGEGEDAELFPSKAEGTSFQFDATRNGSLTIYLEKKKGQTITVTEDGKAMKDFNGIAMTDQAIVVPVKGGKTYVLSTAQPTLNLRGFSFESDGTSGDIARNIAVFKSLYDGETDAEATLLLNDAMVTYIKGDNVFVEDESGATVFYKTNIQFYKDQKLNGSINGISTANGFMPQLDRTAETTYRTVKAVKEAAVAKAVTVEEATLVQNLARFVKIENVKTTKDEHGFTILLDEENDKAIRVADHFNVFYTLPEDIESIEGIIGVSDEGEPMLWPTSKEGILAVVPATIANLADGKYLLKNIASGLYWGAGNDWGTRASLIKQPDFVTLLQQPEGTYHLESQVSNGGTAIYFEGDYMDNGTPKALTINDMGDGTYTIASGDKCYGYDNSTVLGKDLIANDKNARWEIISLEDATAAMSEATEENPVDVTFLVLDSDFGRNHRNGKGLSTNSNQFKNADLDAAWTFNAGNKNNAGKNENWNVESWHSVFTMSQTIENVPNGIYEMTAQGFYRQDDGQTEDLPVFYINDGEQTFLEGGSENSMDMASESFSAGKYFCEPIRVTVVDHTITLGAKGTATHQWCIWDNFQLKYLGPDPDALKLAAEAYEKALADAEALAKEKMSKKALAALTAVIDANSDIDETSEDAIEAAMKALNDGMKAAQPSVNSYKVIAAGAVADNSLDGWSWTNAQGLAVNTWSVEGNEGNDPTGMVVPFIQSWVSKPGPLGEGKLLYTLKDVDPAKVKVTALVRVYSESGNEPAGVTFFAGDKTIADIAEVGEAFEFNGMKGIYTTVEGTGTVNEDGDFVFGFEIADPTFNWIAIKNVTIDYDDDPTAINGVATVRYENGAVYNLNGQKVNSLKKGLYIVNGKKVVIK